MLLFCFPFSLNSAFLCACVRVWGEAVGMKNECKVLVRIKKGYGWQLEEHLKIAGAVSLVGSCGWDQGVSRAWSCSSCCGEGGWGPACSAGGRCISLLCVSHLARTRGLLLTGIVPERIPCHTELQKLHYPPPHPVVVLKSCILVCSRSRP